MLLFALLQGELPAQSVRLDPDFAPLLLTKATEVEVIEQSDGKLIYFGDFTYADGTPGNGIVRMNADGTKDTSFDAGNGTTTYSSVGDINDVKLQSDGKIIVCGYFVYFDGIRAQSIVRLNSDGSHDPTFQLSTTGSIPTFNQVLIQTDGKIVVGGSFGSFLGGTFVRYQIARLNADGSADETFDPSGYFNTSLFGIEHLALQPDGKIVAGGQRYSPLKNGTADYIVRLNANGTRDNTFTMNLSSQSRSVSEFNRMRLNSDGTIFICGTFPSIYGGGSDKHLLLLNSTGEVDPAYTPNYDTSTLYGPRSPVFDAVRQSDGSTVIIGSFSYVNNTARSYMARLKPDGSLDNFNPVFDGIPNNLFLQSDGKIVVFGNFSKVSLTARAGTARLLPTGALDTGFETALQKTATARSICRIPGTTGTSVSGSFDSVGIHQSFRVAVLNGAGAADTAFQLLEIPTGTSSWSYRFIKPVADGKFLLGGYFQFSSGAGKRYLAKLNADGSFDTSFSPQPNYTVDNIALQPDGKMIVVGGFSTIANTARTGIARLNANGTIDATFDPGEGAYGITEVALLPDGKILIAGNFASYNSIPRLRIARLNADGSLDTGFDPGSGANLDIYSISLDHDGGIFIGGRFSSYDGTARQYVARLNPDGSLDSSFDAGTAINNSVYSVKTFGGKLLVGGYFTSVLGSSRGRFVRLNADGSVDGSLSVGIPDGTVNDIAVDDSGGILLAGSFENVDGVQRVGAARLELLSPVVTSPVEQVSLDEGDPATLSVTVVGEGPFTYQWKLNGNDLNGETGSTLEIATGGAGNVGEYSVTVTNSHGSVTNIAAILSLNAPPTIAQQPSNQSIVRNTTATLSVSANGVGTLSYQWYRGAAGEITNPVGTDSSSFTSASLGGDAQFWVAVTNAYGTVSSETATVTVGDPPTITTQPTPTGAVAGGSATFEVQTSGTAPFSYQWKKNGFNTANGTSRILNLTDVDQSTVGNYSVTVSNNFGSITSDSAAFIINTPPFITSSPTSRSVVSGSNVTFEVVAGGDGPLAYIWRLNGNLLSGETSSTLTLTNIQQAQAGNYQVTVSNSYGTASRTANLTINEPPSISIQPSDRFITSGSAATLSLSATGSGTLSYQWYQGAQEDSSSPVGGNSATYTTPDLSTSTVYHVVVASQYGSVISRSVTVNVGNAPSISTHPVSTVVAAGADASFSVSATGDAPLAYQWFEGENPVAGGNGSTLLIQNTQAGDAGIYKVRVSNNFGDVTSNTATLSINSPPFITQAPTNQTAAAGDNVIFTVQASGSAPLTYQWRRNLMDLAGESGTSLSITGVGAQNEGDYTVVVTNSFGTAIGGPAVLTVNSPPTIHTQPTNESLPRGNAAILSVQANGTAPFSYQWYKGSSGNTSEPVGADQATFETPFLNATTSYWVRVTNSFGFSNSNTAILTVGDPPAISAHPLSQTVSSGFNIELSVSHTGTGPFTYTWKKGSAVLEQASSTLSLQGVTETNEGSYTVTVTNAFGTVTSNPAVITVNSPPKITTQPGDVISAEGGEAVFQVVASGDPTLEYQWKLDGSPVPGAIGASLSVTPVTLEKAGVYSVTITNSYGTVTSNGATLTVSAPPTITSSPGTRSIPSGSGATLSVTATGSATLHYQWYIGNFGDISTPVGGDSSILNTGGLNKTTTYWVRVTNEYGSADSAPATVTVGDPPEITSAPAPQFVAAGEPVTFSVTATGTAQLNYVWMKNGNPIPEATSAEYSIANVSSEDAGNYTVRVSNSFGSATSAIASLSVINPPTIVQQPQALTVATGGNAVFSVSADGSPPLQYQWKKDGNDILGQNGLTLAISGATISDEGDYSVSVSNAAGTVTSSAVALMVNAPPVITAEPLARTIQSGQQTTLSVSATGSGPLVYQWYLGESGDTSQPVGIDSFQYITPPLDQSNSYWVSISNPFGLAESETAVVTISNPIPQINSPSVASSRVGALFSFRVSASGIPDTFTASGLPEGLSINPATGIISGLPDEAGEFEVSLEATNENGTGDGLLTVTIFEALPTITSTPSANGSTARSLFYQITATNTPTSYSATGLPSGLSLNNSTGLISGTPAAAVEKDIQIGASNAGGSAFLIVHLTILSTDQPPVVTGASHFAGQVNSFFQQQLTASNSPSSFSVIGLPPGLSLSQTSGLILGTPQQAGTFTATFSASNGNGISAEVQKTFVISPAPDVPVVLPVIVPRLHQGSPVGIDTSASNNPTLFSANGLPPGLSINSVTGRISGTPTNPGTYSVTLTASNSGGTSRPYALPMEVRPPRQTPIIMNSTGIGGRLTVPFSLHLSASRTPTEFRAPNLPSGLSLNPSTGLITGTPLVIGVSEVEISAMNEDGWGAPVTMIFRITAAPTAPVVQPGVSLSQRVGETFRHNIFATENPTLYSASGLPPGLALDPATGFIGGIGTQTGIYAVLVTAENSLGASAPEILTITITAPLGTSEITSSLKVRGELGVAFNYTPKANQEPSSYSVSDLPPGLSFNGTTISGVPILSGKFNVILSASNRRGAGTPVIMELIIDPGTIVPAITSSPGLTASQNQPYSYQITAINGPITSYGAENLPPGLSIDPSTGAISGTPLVAGRFQVELLASNTNGTGKLVTSLAINPVATAPVIFSKTNVGAYAGDPFSYQIKATGSPDIFRATGLPSWLSINTSTGLISGFTGPTRTYSFTIQAANDAGWSLPLVVSLNSSSLRSFSRIDGPVSVQGYVNEVLYIKPIYSGLSPDGSYIYSSVDDARWWQYYETWEYDQQRWKTLPILTGTTGFTTRISANDGRSGDARRIQVTILSRHDDLRITSPGTIYATAGQATEYQFTTAAGDATGYKITHLSSYPAGITLDGETGVLAGIPDSPGTYTLVAQAERGLEIGPSREITFVVNPAPGTPNITESPALALRLFARSDLARTAANANSATILSATGHVGQPFSYTLGSTTAATAFEADSLPDGLLINPTTGEIAGTPSFAGIFPVPVRALNSAGYGVDAILQITILAASGTPEITSDSIASAQVGVPFSYNITADASPLGYNAIGLPAWLLLDDATGAITGTPTEPGTFSISLGAINSVGSGNLATLSVTVAPATGSPQINSTAIAAGSVGSAFSFQLTASNSPDLFEADMLPPGLSLDNASGLITGTPLETGNFTVNVGAVNTSGIGQTSILEIQITPPTGSPAITSATSHIIREGVPFNITITATNEPSSFNSSTLPAGMFFDGVTGSLSGTPEQPGSFSIAFSANNAIGTGTPQEITLEVLPSIGSFTDWANYLPIGKRGAVDDPLSSGSPNLLRFALGMESTETTNDRLPIFEMVYEDDQTYPSLVFIRPIYNNNIIFSLQGGENLSDLSPVNSTLSVLDQPYPGFERVRLRQTSALSDNSLWFLRLQVDESPD